MRKRKTGKTVHTSWLAHCDKGLRTLIGQCLHEKKARHHIMTAPYSKK